MEIFLTHDYRHFSGTGIHVIVKTATERFAHAGESRSGVKATFGLILAIDLSLHFQVFMIIFQRYLAFCAP